MDFQPALTLPASEFNVTKVMSFSSSRHKFSYMYTLFSRKMSSPRHNLSSMYMSFSRNMPSYRHMLHTSSHRHALHTLSSRNKLSFRQMTTFHV